MRVKTYLPQLVNVFLLCFFLTAAAAAQRVPQLAGGQSTQPAQDSTIPLPITQPKP